MNRSAKRGRSTRDGLTDSVRSHRSRKPSLPPSIALLAIVLAPTVAAAVWLWWSPGDGLWISVAAVIVVSGLLCLLAGPLAFWTAITKSRTPIYETLPRETTGPVLVIPVATTVSTSLLTVGVAVGTLTFGDNPVVAVELRSYMGILSAVGLVIGLLAPMAAVQVIRLEREGVEVAIFDPHAPPQKVLDALPPRWEQLRDAKRRWYAARRRAALGELENAPAFAWPTGPYGSKATRPKTLIASLTVLGGLGGVLISLATFFTSTVISWLALGSFVVLPGALTGLAVVLVAYTLTAQEQRTAGLLRRAHTLATARVAEQAAANRGARIRPQRRTALTGQRRGRRADTPSEGLVAAGAIELAVDARIKRMTRIELLAHAVARDRPWR